MVRAYQFQTLFILFLSILLETGDRSTSLIKILLPVVMTAIILAISIVTVVIVIVWWKKKSQRGNASPDHIYDVPIFIKPAEKSRSNPITKHEEAATNMNVHAAEIKMEANIAYGFGHRCHVNAV